VVQTHEVLVEVDFYSTDAEVFPSGKWLGGVSSVAGAIGDQPSGNIYQNGLAIDNTWNVFTWAPQVWLGDTPVHIEAIPVSTGSYASASYAAFYLRTDIVDAGVTFQIWAYRTFDDYLYDTPSYYSFRTWSTTDTNLLVGETYHIIQNNGYWFKHFQFGIESNVAITETDWGLQNAHASYYDGVSNWHYSPAYVTEGDSSCITWIGQNLPYVVGGEPYPGVNIDFTMNDDVIWKQTGSPIADGSLLWSGTGTVLDVVAKPYLVTNGGTLAVTIGDAATGYPLPYSTFTVKDEETEEVIEGFEDVETDSNGHKVVTLPPGTYAVTASHLTFDSVTHHNVVVSDGECTTQYFLLRQESPGPIPMAPIPVLISAT
jgi:hypothetical protein